MPKTVHGDIQTDTNDGRKFITRKVALPDGRTAYRKIYLQTRDNKTARRRAAVLLTIQDPDIARQIMTYVASAKTTEEELSRLAEFETYKPLTPTLSLDRARADLSDLTGEDNLTADIVNRFRNADKQQQSEILQALGVPADIIADNPDMLSDRTLQINKHYKPQHKAIAAAFNIDEKIAETLAKDTPARGPKLSACLSEFDIEQDQKGTSSQHRNAYKNRFNEFIKLIGDKSIKSLTKTDFVKYRDKVLAEKKGKSAKTINDSFKPIEAILKTARTRMPDKTFPDGLSDWFSVFSTLPYKPKATNRAPIPVDIFKSLLANAETWIQNKKTERDGLLVHACLCLAVNTGSTSIDLARLKWSELLLDSDIPLFTQPRTKTETNEDMTIPVKTPLLPQTVASLKRWKQYQDKHYKSDSFFVTVRGLPLSEAKKVIHLFADIRRITKDINGWEARHCRNIGETLRRNNQLPADMGTAWLRHSENGTNLFYRGEAPDDYLMPLIDIIGKTYFV